MANLIITVIAIALVAIASLMGAYYGGAAFLNNQSAANASTVLNQAQQIAGAWNAYLSDNLNVPPTTLDGSDGASTNLVGQKYLAQIPIAPAGAGGIPAQALTVQRLNGHYFAYANVGACNGASCGTVADNNAAACIRIIKTAIGSAAYNTAYGSSNAFLPYAGQGAVYNSAGGNGTFGCAHEPNQIPDFDNTKPTLQPGYIMEYLLQ